MMRASQTYQHSDTVGLFFVSLGKKYYRQRTALLAPTASELSGAITARSSIDCCSRCFAIQGCKSVNFRHQKSSTTAANCVPLTRSINDVAIQQVTSDVDWDWYYTDQWWDKSLVARFQIKISKHWVNSDFKSNLLKSDFKSQIAVHAVLSIFWMLKNKQVHEIFYILNIR